MFWLLVIVALLLFMYQFLFKPQLYWYQNNVKQTFPIPLLGDNFWSMLGFETFVDCVQRVYNKFKNERYVGVYQTGLPTLMLRDPELIKQVTVKDFDHFLDHRNFALENVDELLSKNLFTLRGDAWRNMRATLSPTFTSSKMRAMFVLMEKSAQQYVDFYLQQSKSVMDIDVKDSLTRFANDVIANCAFGITVDSLKNPENEFYMNGKETTNFRGFWRMAKLLFNVALPKMSSLLKMSIFSAEITDFFKKLVQNTIKVREEQNIIRPDMINLLIEARKGKLRYDDSSQQRDAGFATVDESEVGTKHSVQKQEMTDLDMAAQVMIFFFAGFETISTVMSFMLVELAINPDVQDRLRQEIDETAEETNGKLSYDVLNKMKYLDMVVSESLRKHPPLVAIDRVCTKPFIIEPQYKHEDPVKLNVGDTIWLPVYGLHYDPELYPNPKKFDPERFSDERKEQIKPYTYLPFGSGPRNCIGSRFALMECKTLTFHLLRNFELVVIDKTVIPIKYEKGSFNPTMEGGFWVGFKRRLDA